MQQYRNGHFYLTKHMKSVLTLFAQILVLCTFGQTTYPKGVYLSFEEIKTKSPGLEVELDVERRTRGEIKMNGGNDYKLFKSDKSIPKKTIKKEYYAYSDGDSLYINCIHYRVVLLVEVKNHLLLFRFDRSFVSLVNSVYLRLIHFRIY